MPRPPTHSAAEICALIALHPEPVVTTGDLHEDLELTQRGTQARLERLVEEGYLDRKSVGANGVVYWLTDKGRDTLADEGGSPHRE